MEMNWLQIGWGLLAGGLIGYWVGFFDGAHVARKVRRMIDERML
jgi:hypothetical protein